MKKYKYMKSILIMLFIVLSVLTACRSRHQVILRSGESYHVKTLQQGKSQNVYYCNTQILYARKISLHDAGGDHIREEFFYYPNGTIMRYNYFVNNERVYQQEYNEHGITLSIKGDPLIYHGVSTLDTLNNETLYQQEIRFVNAPNINVTVQVNHNNNNTIHSAELNALGQCNHFRWHCTSNKTQLTQQITYQLSDNTKNSMQSSYLLSYTLKNSGKRKPAKTSGFDFFFFM